MKHANFQRVSFLINFRKRHNEKNAKALTVAYIIGFPCTVSGDGINDFLLIDGIANYPDNKLQVMNRSGQLIFEAKNYDNSAKVFDGHSNKTGAMQLPGTYFTRWIIWRMG